MRYTPYGGAEVFLSRFLTELLKQGHTIEVFSTAWEERKGVIVHKVRTFGPSFLRPLIFASKVHKAVDMENLDCVLSLERTYCQDIYRAGDGCHREWLIRRGNTVSWFKRFLISLNPLHAVLLYLEKRLFSSKRLNTVVANSNSVKRDIIRHYGFPEDRICVIYNGIEPSTFERRDKGDRATVREGMGITEDTTLLLFVGSGFERKGLIYAIRALSILKDKGDIRLLVIGRGNTSKYLREARRLRVEDRVIFKGPVKGALEFYPAGDIFVLPSIYEPFSNACLEAMAAGLPVVTSRVNGASEILTDGVNGAILEDPTDHFEIAGKIAQFLDKEKRKKACELARREAVKYPIERTVTEFLKLIESN